MPFFHSSIIKLTKFLVFISNTRVERSYIKQILMRISFIHAKPSNLPAGNNGEYGFLLAHETFETVT